jgi:hypothetical protein
VRRERTMGEEWKREHAEDSHTASEHELVERVLSEFAENMGFRREGLPEYGLQKIVETVAQVVRARTLGFDPDLLRLNAEEADEQTMAVVRMALKQGKLVVVVAPEAHDGE